MKTNRTRNIVMVLLGLTLLMSFVIYKKVINPEHREIFKEATQFTLDANDLQFHFLDNQEEATSKYVNKVVETYGAVTEVGPTLAVLEEKIQVNFLEGNTQQIRVGDTIKIKGRCIGFDEFLLLVKIDQANIINTTNEN